MTDSSKDDEEENDEDDEDSEDSEDSEDDQERRYAVRCRNSTCRLLCWKLKTTSAKECAEECEVCWYCPTCVNAFVAPKHQTPLDRAMCKVGTHLWANFYDEKMDRWKCCELQKILAAPLEFFLIAVTGEIVEKNRDKIWIATQDPIIKNVRCETYAVYLMYTTYLTNEVLKPQGYHLIDGPVLENSHSLEIIELPRLDWDTSLEALNEKYPVPIVTEDRKIDEGSDEEEETETETESDRSIVCLQFLVFFWKCMWFDYRKINQKTKTISNSKNW